MYAQVLAFIVLGDKPDLSCYLARGATETAQCCAQMQEFLLSLSGPLGASFVTVFAMGEKSLLQFQA